VLIALSWVAAVVACVGYGAGSVLQSIGARRTTHSVGVSGFARIAVQLPYLLGLGLDAFAFLANVVALQRLPLFLVQATLTASVGVTAVIAAIRGTKLTWKDWLSLAVLGSGLVLLAISATSESAVRISSTAEWLILASSTLPALVGLVGVRLRGRSSAPILASAAGLAFTGVAVASRGISGEHPGWALLAEPLVWTIAIQGLIGTVFFALALQRGSVTSVTAVTFMVDMVIPSVIGLLLFGDSVGHGLGAYAVVGFALSIGGTISLIRFAE
jgi:drug/metabolite transporter (DMT)-like permease